MAERKVMGASRSIHKRNFVYHTIYPYCRAFFFNYYGKVEIRGRENIPRGEPVIFAPNHQNALMDALIVLFAAPGDVVFLARADIFNKPLLAWFLNSLKILPVFRQRDGATELGKNEEIFDISVDILKHRHYLCVMPEGNHGHQRKLRAFGKGIFRIAFAAQEEHGREPFVKIVPVGLDFGDYVKQNSSLFVNFGKPIDISDYWEQYEENVPRTLNAAKKQLIEDLRPQMIDIRTDEYYEMVHSLRTIFNDNMREEMGIRGRKLSDRFVADKEMIGRFDRIIAEEAAAVVPDGGPADGGPAAGDSAASGSAAGGSAAASGPAAADRAAPAAADSKRKKQLDELDSKVRRYEEGLKRLKIRDWVVRDKGLGLGRAMWRWLTLIVLSPLFLFGFLTNIIPFWLPVFLVRNIKDRQFHSSVKVGAGLLLIFPIFYILMTVLVAVFTWSIAWWIWIAFLVSLFPAGKIAHYWYRRWKKTTRGSWFANQLRTMKTFAVEQVKLREEIINDTRRLIF